MTVSLVGPTNKLFISQKGVDLCVLESGHRSRIQLAERTPQGQISHKLSCTNSVLCLRKLWERRTKNKGCCSKFRQQSSNLRFKRPAKKARPWPALKIACSWKLHECREQESFLLNLESVSECCFDLWINRHHLVKNSTGAPAQALLPKSAAMQKHCYFGTHKACCVHMGDIKEKASYLINASITSPVHGPSCCVHRYISNIVESLGWGLNPLYTVYMCKYTHCCLLSMRVSALDGRSVHALIMFYLGMSGVQCEEWGVSSYRLTHGLMFWVEELRLHRSSSQSQWKNVIGSVDGWASGGLAWRKLSKAVFLILYPVHVPHIGYIPFFRWLWHAARFDVHPEATVSNWIPPSYRCFRKFKSQDFQGGKANMESGLLLELSNSLPVQPGLYIVAREEESPFPQDLHRTVAYSLTMACLLPRFQSKPCRQRVRSRQFLLPLPDQVVTYFWTMVLLYIYCVDITYYILYIMYYIIYIYILFIYIYILMQGLF